MPAGSGSLERARLAEAAEAANLARERESLRNTVLASISHDLRTPLAVIAGAGGALAERGAMLDEATRVSLARSIEAKATEMTGLVSNVLDVMRFESGEIVARRDWQSLLVAMALQSQAERLAQYLKSYAERLFEFVSVDQLDRQAGKAALCIPAQK